MTSQLSTSTTIAIVVAILGPLVTWFLSRRKTRAEAQKIAAEAERTKSEDASIMLGMWKDTVEELRTQVRILSQEVHELRLEVATLRQENALLKGATNPPPSIPFNHEA